MMNSIKYFTSACKYCRHYVSEGRRGGVCQQLGAPVQGNWKACSLSLPPFAPSWETLEDAWTLPDAKRIADKEWEAVGLTKAKEKTEVTTVSLI